MSDGATLILWAAFGGFAVLGAGSVALVASERRRAAVAARITRATRTGPTPRNNAPRDALSRLKRPILLMGERMAAMIGGEARETAADLASAGFRSRDALVIYAFAKTVLPLLALILGAPWVLTSGPLGLGTLLPAGVVIAAALAVSKGIDIWIDRRRAARLARIRLGVPDLLELLVITSEAGLGPQPALNRVAREMAASHPDLAQDILQMVTEIAMTNDRRAAYARLTQRVPLPEIAVFTQTLDQSDTYGTPFSRAMRTLIAETRANRLMQIEEKAARLPVIMTLPLIFCIMPAVFVVLVGPAALSVIDNILSGG